MNDEERDEIVRTAHETLERLQHMEQRDSHDANTLGGHFDPERARRMRKGITMIETPEPTEPTITRAAPAAISDAWAAYVEQRLATAIQGERANFLEIIAHALAKSFEESERKASRVLHAELHALRAEVCKLESLLEALRRETQSERSKIIDLPAVLRRNDVN